jgi:hypothetical protein
VKQLLLACFLCVTAAGCSTVAQTQDVVETDPELATPAHWIAQPANASVSAADYDKLWEACIGAARWHGYPMDRLDYRNGLMISRPIVSQQIFEPWKRDLVTFGAIVDSTLATESRQVRFEIRKRDDGSFECVPKVVIQRFSSAERRITSVTRYRESFDIKPGAGSRERDKGREIPDTYWYATGRDADLERTLAEGIRSRLG